jgi:hypothetical protein
VVFGKHDSGHERVNAQMDTSTSQMRGRGTFLVFRWSSDNDLLVYESKRADADLGDGPRRGI